MYYINLNQTISCEASCATQHTKNTSLFTVRVSRPSHLCSGTHSWSVLWPLKIYVSKVIAECVQQAVFHYLHHILSILSAGFFAHLQSCSSLQEHIKQPKWESSQYLINIINLNIIVINIIIIVIIITIIYSFVKYMIISLFWVIYRLSNLKHVRWCHFEIPRFDSQHNAGIWWFERRWTREIFGSIETKSSRMGLSQRNVHTLKPKLTNPNLLNYYHSEQRSQGKAWWWTLMKVHDGELHRDCLRVNCGHVFGSTVRFISYLLPF